MAESPITVNSCLTNNQIEVDVFGLFVIQLQTVPRGIFVLDLSCYYGKYDLCYHNYVHDDGAYCDLENPGLGKYN